MPDNTGSVQYLTDISDRDKPWDKHRAEASGVQALYRGDEFESIALRIDYCSRRLVFKTRTNPETGERKFKLHAARFCRVRHCPICQWRRSLMWVARALEGMPKIEADYPKARWIFLTLTVKNCELSDLRSTIGVMNKAFTRMTQLKDWPGLGWAKSVEVTAVHDIYDGSNYLGTHGKTWAKKWEKDNKGKKLRLELTQEVHPHFHVLMMVGPGYFRGQSYLSQRQWSQIWQKCLRSDYPPHVDVRTVKPKDGAVGDLSPIAGAISETLKYAVKPDDLLASREWLHEITRQLHKSQAIAIGGCLRQYWKTKAKETDEDFIHVEKEELEPEFTEDEMEITFGWREQVKRYAMEE